MQSDNSGGRGERNGKAKKRAGSSLFFFIRCFGRAKPAKSLNRFSLDDQ